MRMFLLYRPGGPVHLFADALSYRNGELAAVYQLANFFEQTIGDLGSAQGSPQDLNNLLLRNRFPRFIAGGEKFLAGPPERHIFGKDVSYFPRRLTSQRLGTLLREGADQKVGRELFQYMSQGLDGGLGIAFGFHKRGCGGAV